LSLRNLVLMALAKKLKSAKSAASEKLPKKFSGKSSAKSKDGLPRMGNLKKAALVLADGQTFEGWGFGAYGEFVGEICFNTSITGYQEILTDPSYAGQIITFTFPHIGNVGCNTEDMEAATRGAYGLVTRDLPTAPSNYRAEGTFNDWLISQNVVGIAGIDTRALTAHIRDNGAPHGVIAFYEHDNYDMDKLTAKAKDWTGLEGLDLASTVSTAETYEWSQSTWSHKEGYSDNDNAKYHVVAIDYGIKRNILRELVNVGCKVTVVNAATPASEILALKPDGVFLSNGPGDPAATGEIALPIIKELMHASVPIFGICLGHQLLALALGGKTRKLHLGHRGANQPVQDLTTGKVEITSQNHGFEVDPESLAATAELTHLSLFDRTNEGLRAKNYPAFSVQYHPEASPGPKDAHYLFTRFVWLMESSRPSKKAEKQA